MMGARAFVVGKLSSGPTTHEALEDAATAHLGISVPDARFAIWSLANVGVVEGVLDDKLSLATGKSQVNEPPGQTSAPATE